jgi:uncharacterized protein (DUF1330 family)
MRLVLTCLLLITVTGCAPSKKPPVETGRVIHVVVCWLKEPGDIASRRELIDVSHRFKDIPGVVDVQTGQVLRHDHPRPIEDGTYDVLIVMTFQNPRALRQYHASDEHQRVVKQTLQPLTHKVVVYDALEYAPRK